MNINAFSRSKFRANQYAGDDSMLIVPGTVVALLDGATDPFARIERVGESSGKYASNTVARICAELFSESRVREASAETILRIISSRFAQSMSSKDFIYGPSTTLAMAIFLDEQLRIISIGDTGIRINGSNVYCHNKPIDSITTTARVAIYHFLKDKYSDPDMLENQTRIISFHGLEQGRKDKLIGEADIDVILRRVFTQHSQVADHADIERLVLKGILSQKEYANRGEHPLGFSTLNGVEPLMDDVIDIVFNFESINTVEMFTDGYLTLPKGTGVQDWEEEYSYVEQVDFTKTTTFKNVKGSTSKEFFDDRSIISLDFP
ncbi:hypothetical protein NF212_06745 [Parasalinivibrio latis]|uniref:hypothetical protein n=1 Tax=Parasalinivibrio latis TaxID=2952610 RepID=UPI0030E0CEA8